MSTNCKRTVSPETREKMRQAKLGKKMSAETRAKMSAAKTGHTVTETTRQKMSDSHRASFLRKTSFTSDMANAIRAEYNSRKTKANPDGEKVTYTSLAKKFGISIAYVYSILKNKIWV